MRRLCFFVCLLVWILAFCPLVYADIPELKLVEPYDGASVSTEVLFKWEAVSGAISYTLQIFDWFDQTESNEYTTTQNQYQLPSSTLSESTPYYWRVKVSDASGESEWSPIWRFRTLPNAVDPFQREDDTDDDGIPDRMENKEYLHTDVDKKTLFVRPKKRTGPDPDDPDDFEYWDGFIRLFPGGPPGRANIKPFTDAGIEVVVIGDLNNPYKRMREFWYDPADDPNKPPCSIMEIVSKRTLDADGKPVTFYSYGYNGHTFLDHGIRDDQPVNVWTWDRPAYTDSNPIQNEYNFPRLYPYPVDRYFDEGAYDKIEIGRYPATTDCSDSLENCNKASPMNFPDNATGLPFTRSTETVKTVEFNAISFDYYGEIKNIDIANRGKPYTKTNVKAKLVVHEMGHGLLSAVEEEHCENPCCIMYDRMIDWEQLLFGLCATGKADKCCNQVCVHSPGGSKDIRHHGVVYNIRQQNNP